MGYLTAADSTLEITFDLPATLDAAGFGALNTWVEVNGIKAIPDYGSEFGVNTYALLKGAPVSSKGTPLLPEQEIEYLYDAGNAGQNLARQSVPIKSGSGAEVSVAVTGVDGEVDYYTAIIVGSSKARPGAEEFTSSKFKFKPLMHPINVPAS